MVLPRYTPHSDTPVRSRSRPRSAPALSAPAALVAGGLAPAPATPDMAPMQKHGALYHGRYTKSGSLAPPKSGSIRVSRHLFATLTFDRSVPAPQNSGPASCLGSPDVAWLLTRRRSFAFIQRLKRLYGGPLEYLMVVEKHSEKDGQIWPHVHFVFQSPHGGFTYTHRRSRDWIEAPPYKALRACWPHGFADFQIPRGKGTSATRYVRKTIAYMRKSGASCRTLNRHINSADPALSGLTGSALADKVKELSSARRAAAAARSETCEKKDVPAPSMPATFRPSEFGLSDTVPLGLRRFTWSRHFDWSVCHNDKVLGSGLADTC